MRIRLLGIYLCLLAVAQFAFYGLAGINPHEHSGYFLYFNPRFGLLFLEESIKAGSFPSFLSWTSVTILFCVGSVMLWKPVLKLYLITESMMGIPSILAFLFIIVVNIKTTDGFSIGELPKPVLTFVLFSGPPFLWALLLKNKQKTEISG